jgi:hypothetical protein
MRLDDVSFPSSASERIREVASIFAAGVLRLRARAALSPDRGPDCPAEFLPDPESVPLEVLAPTVLSVHSS